MNIDTVTLTRAQVAWLLGMSDSWTRDQMQAGDLPRPGATADEYVQAFVALKMKKRGFADDGSALNLEDERARLASEQADRVAMENAERRRELASLPDMTSAVASVIEISLARLLRVGAIVAKGDVALKQRIDTAVSDALEELSATRVAELAGGGFDEEDEPDDEDDASDD